MRKFLYLLLPLFLINNAWAWQRPPLPETACAIHAPWGTPKSQKPNVTRECREGYFLSHDNEARIPVWGAWQVRHDRVNGCWPRTNAFARNQHVPYSAHPNDYAGTGYDKGHLANDAHQTWAQLPSYESFLMTNMYPQLPGLNRGIWKLLETATGAWAFERKTTLIVYAGAIYDTAANPKIGSGVVIPSGFFKIIVDQRTNEVLAFIFPHREDLGKDLATVQTTVTEIERYSGINFPLHPAVNKAAKAAIWNIDYKTVADDKKKTCKR